MPAFQFRLASLQKYRESQRDVCRQALAQALAHEAEFASEKSRFEAEREGLLEEMRSINDGQQLSINQAAVRRYHAGQLARQIVQIEQLRQQAEEVVLKCRQGLVLADQAVKVLEKLSERQLEEYLADQERRAAREREENWQAARLREPVR